MAYFLEIWEPQYSGASLWTETKIKSPKKKDVKSGLKKILNNNKTLDLGDIDGDILVVNKGTVRSSDQIKEYRVDIIYDKKTFVPKKTRLKKLPKEKWIVMR